jgi:hypothetical protein
LADEWSQNEFSCLGLMGNLSLAFNYWAWRDAKVQNPGWP